VLCPSRFREARLLRRIIGHRQPIPFPPFLVGELGLRGCLGHKADVQAFLVCQELRAAALRPLRLLMTSPGGWGRTCHLGHETGQVFHPEHLRGPDEPWRLCPFPLSSLE